MAARTHLLRQGTRLPQLTLRGWGFLAVSVGLFVLAPMLGQREIAFAASASLTLPLLSLVLVAVRRPKLTVMRRFSPETASAGTDCEVILSIQNWGIAPTPAALWYDDAVAPLHRSSVATLPALPAFRSLETDRPRVTTVRYLIDTPRRGVHSVGPFWVSFGDPFGLATRRFSVGASDSITVTPDVETLSRGSFRLPSGDGQAMQSRRPSASGEQDVIARKYQTGDSIRRVHWPATARHSELMVRQDDQHTDHEAIVVLDNRLDSFVHTRRGRSDPAQSDAFEGAVSMAVSIALHLLHEGYRTVFVESHDPRTRHTKERAADGVEELLLRGAHTQLGSEHPPLAVRDIVADAGRVSGELPPLFAVLGNVDPQSLDALSRAASASSSALAFVVHDVPRASAGSEPEWARQLCERLTQAGWAARLVSPVDTPSSVWEPDTARIAR